MFCQSLYMYGDVVLLCLSLKCACVWQIVCVTNFEGQERQRVKQMITLIGAKYTGYMTRAHSVLIAKQ